MNTALACIPREICRNKNLKPLSLIILFELSTTIDKSGECLIDYEKLSNSFNRSKSAIHIYVNELIQNNYISLIKINNLETVNLLKNKKMHGLGIGNLICCWCGVSTTTLHSHHYPIPKKDNGKETIEICPNCHHEYHYNNNSNKAILNFGNKIISEIINIRNNPNDYQNTKKL